LADQIVEARRTILAREHPIGRIVRRRAAERQTRLGFVRAAGVVHNAFPSAAAARVLPRLLALRMDLLRLKWEADERPEPRSLGLFPPGPARVGEGPAHRQPPAPISSERRENASARPVGSTAPLGWFSRHHAANTRPRNFAMAAKASSPCAN